MVRAGGGVTAYGIESLILGFLVGHKMLGFAVPKRVTGDSLQATQTENRVLPDSGHVDYQKLINFGHFDEIQEEDKRINERRLSR